MNVNKNNQENKMEKKSKNGLFFSNRQVSWMLSFFILTSFFVFIAGYFLGKKKGIEKFYNKVNQDSFADSIYYSVCSIYDKDEAFIKQESTEQESENLDVSENNIVVDAVNNQKNGEFRSLKKENKVKKPKDNKNYYAELIGFGTTRAANKFADRLKKRGFSVIVKRRKSQTAKGRTIVWYQVITEKFDTKNDLIAFVDIIKDKEKLKGVRIVQV